MGDTESFQHFISALLTDITVKVRDRFEYRQQVVPYRETPENGGFLRQVSDPFASPLMHREPADVLTIEQDSALVAADEAANHVEAGGFPGSVWTKQANDFAAADSDIDIINNRSSAKPLNQALGGE